MFKLFHYRLELNCRLLSISIYLLNVNFTRCQVDKSVKFLMFTFVQLKWNWLFSTSVWWASKFKMCSVEIDCKVNNYFTKCTCDHSNVFWSTLHTTLVIKFCVFNLEISFMNNITWRCKEDRVCSNSFVALLSPTASGTEAILLVILLG